MKFSKAFTYMFDDPDWVSKYTIGIVISLVPILNFAWIGYAIGIMRNIAKGEQYPLPKWEDIGGKFKDGLFLAIAGFIYTLPLTLFMCLAWAIIAIPAMMAGNNSDAAGAVAGLGAAVYVLIGCCAFIYVLVFSFFAPAMMIHYARTDSFGSLFQVKEIIQLATKNIGDYMMGWVAQLVGVVILSVVAVIPCIGQLVAAVAGMAWVNTVSGYAFGQVGLALGAMDRPAGVVGYPPAAP
jgi:hypothetical protein